jgi:hypothetical protein
VCQLYIRQLRSCSTITASGFFPVNRALVTSFLATTFTYWVILIQFTQSQG